MTASADESDCIRLLARFTRERCVWTTDIARQDRPRALDLANMAFADLRYAAASAAVVRDTVLFKSFF